MARTIRVTGKGTLHIKPDMTRLTLVLSGLEEDYDRALQRSSRDTEFLRNVLSALGFEPADLKTLSFDVDTKYESCRDRNNDWKQRFVGYEYSHRMKLEFPSDNALLGRVLYALATAPVSPEFRISYFVGDPESAKNELLGKAVTDAIAKAGVLAKAAGATLGEILSIDYSWGQIDFEVRPMEADVSPMCCADEDVSFDVNIEPDDAVVSDTVTVVWEIA